MPLRKMLGVTLVRAFENPRRTAVSVARTAPAASASPPHRKIVASVSPKASSDAHALRRSLKVTEHQMRELVRDHEALHPRSGEM
jgi:hypothetical protein